VVVHALGFDLPRRVEPVQGGADTLIWRLETDTGSYALRLFRAEQAPAAQREVAAMAAAREHGLPVPVLAREGIWSERPVMVLSWMPGLTLRQALIDRPEAANALGEAFGRAQARIHQCPAPAMLRERSARWLAIPGAEAEITKHVQQACAQTQRLLHLDYHPLNVLVEQGAISAILDWTNACSGDPRCDLARTETILTFAPAHHPEAQATEMWKALIAGWRRGYTAMAGAIDGMGPFRSWAAAFLVHDLRPRLGRPDLPWVTEELLERVGHWAAVQGGTEATDAF